MHQTLHQLIATFQLKEPQAKSLWTLAQFNAPPTKFGHTLARLLIVAAALLAGAGAIFWIAANWQEMSRLSKLALLQAGLGAALVAACLWPRGRTACVLLATLLLGAVLAFIGQTYQTGADPWQLFAIWAALSLLWMIALRKDGLWVLWVLIAATAIALWTGANAGGFLELFIGSLWGISSDWLLWFALVAVAFGIQTFGLAGAQPKWTLRAALVLALTAVTSYATGALFFDRTPIYFLGLLLVCITAVVLYLQKVQDFSALCVAVLAVDVMLIAGLGRMLFHGRFEIGNLLLLGIGAAIIVAASVGSLLKHYRATQATQTEQATAGSAT